MKIEGLGQDDQLLDQSRDICRENQQGRQKYSGRDNMTASHRGIQTPLKQADARIHGISDDPGQKEEGKAAGGSTYIK